MKFKIANPDYKYGFGDLSFTRPDSSAAAARLNELEAYCRKRARDEFGDSEVIAERLERELDMIARTGSAVAFEIAREIAKLSDENGFPVCLFGDESGLLVMYLLGVSGIHPSRYDYSSTPTELYIRSVTEKRAVDITLAIAEPLREYICPRLTEKFGDIECNDEDYLKIHIPPCDALEKIGELSKALNYRYYDIVTDNAGVLNDAQREIFKNDLGWDEKHEKPRNTTDVARYYAFSRCFSKGEKSPALFSDVRKYVFRDDILEALKVAGYDGPQAYALMKLWLNPIKKEEDLKLIESSLSPGLIYIFKELGNQWSRAACISRVNVVSILTRLELCSQNR